jgi:hypothetical protein
VMRISIQNVRVYFMKLSFAAALLACLILQGCGVIVPGTPWQARPEFKGPMLFDGVRSQAFWRCAAIDQVMSKGPCEIGYLNQRNEVVRLGAIEEEINKFLPVAQLKEPIRLYILTISPTVVLAVPGRKTSTECYGTSYQAGCQEYEGHTFNFGSTPEIGDNSYWFSPTLKIGPFTIPKSDEFYIHIPDSETVTYGLIDISAECLLLVRRSRSIFNLHSRLLDLLLGGWASPVTAFHSPKRPASSMLTIRKLCWTG